MFRVATLFAAISFAVSGSLSAQTVVTDPVGFITVSIKSATADVNPVNPPTPALSFVGLGLAQPVTYQSTMSLATNVITDGNATWADNQYNGSYYIEILTGTGTGVLSQITVTSGTNKTLTLADDLSAYAGSGLSYRIRKNWTLASVFGANDESGLQGGDLTSADEVLVYDSTNTQQPYTTYYYKTTTGLGGVGWRSTNSTSADASNAPFKPGAGFIIRRHQIGDVILTLAGAVKMGQTQLRLTPGLNFPANVYPSGSLTLGNSNLYFNGDTAKGLAGGDLTTADQVLIYDNTANPPQYNTYYYKTTTGLGGVGWRSTSSTSADASATVIPVGSSLIVQRLNQQPFVWTVPQPF